MVDMPYKEAIEMMERSKQEIQSLQKQIEHLTPKAKAYDELSFLLDQMRRGNNARAGGDDFFWTLNHRIAELKQANDPTKGTAGMNNPA